MTDTTQGHAGAERFGALVFTYPDHLTRDQRERVAATMRTTFASLVAGARAERAAVAVTR